MAFGQQSGSPASGRDIAELLRLLNDAGYSDFRDARGAMGFSQRQAGGKFSRDEVAGYVETLQAAADAAEVAAQEPVALPEPPVAPPAVHPDALVTPITPVPKRAAPRAAKAAKREPAVTDTALQDVPTDQLAAELQRRGWVVMEP
jgi:hypothetical protein